MEKPDWEGFGKAIMREWQEHWDVEASEKFKLAVEFKLLREIEGGFDPEKHEDAYGCAEPGDSWFEVNF